MAPFAHFELAMAKQAPNAMPPTRNCLACTLHSSFSLLLMPLLASARLAANAAAATNRIISSTCYSTNGSPAPFLTLSFSGAGNLLSYHLGVAASLYRASATSDGKSKRRQHLPTIKAVSGSSSGAIAATVFVRLPHRIEEYADTFLSEGGRAFAILKDMLHDEERRLVSVSGADGCTEGVARGGLVAGSVGPSQHTSSWRQIWRWLNCQN